MENVLPKLDRESQAAFDIRCRLEMQHKAVFKPEHKAHFFENIWSQNPTEQVVVWFLDSLYAALMAEEKKVAFRSFVQASEYSAPQNYRYLRYHFETAMHDAKQRIESFLEG